MKNQEECICALATPAGGAIGIIRLSGHDAGSYGYQLLLYKQKRE
jgi:tRNA U34 5-carboxymethylaminomethyl modifying GTPase MnmE/TrmE